MGASRLPDYEEVAHLEYREDHEPADAESFQGLGFGVQGLVFGVWGVGFGIWGEGFRVWYLVLGSGGLGWGLGDEKFRRGPAGQSPNQQIDSGGLRMAQ